MDKKYPPINYGDINDWEELCGQDEEYNLYIESQRQLKEMSDAAMSGTLFKN